MRIGVSKVKGIAVCAAPPAVSQKGSPSLAERNDMPFVCGGGWGVKKKAGGEAGPLFNIDN